MALRDPILYFADKVTTTIAEAMRSLSEEGWRDLDIKSSGNTIIVTSADQSVEMHLDHPPVGMGDFALPCFQLTGLYGAPPENVAFQLFPHLQRQEDLEEPVLAGPYLNFSIRPERLVEETLRSAIELGEQFGTLESKGITVVLEHTSANPNGPLHVGRARNPIIGDSITRVMRKAGYDVTTHYYVNDMGRQVVLLMWGLERARALGETPAEGKADHRLVRYYQEANKLVEDDPTAASEVQGIIARIEGGDRELLDQVRSLSMEVMEGIRGSLERLGISHDEIVTESTFVLDGSVKGVMDTLGRSEYTVEEEGALALELEPFGIHGRRTRFVFQRKDGTSLYVTRDLAYHLWKRSQGDLLINVLGEDHKLEVRQLEIALQILGSDAKIEPVFYSFVSLPEGKMSTREGRTVHLDVLMDEAVRRALDDTRERRPELDDETVSRIAHAVGLGAIRYNIVRVQPEKSMVFKWEDALNFEGASAPFVQYSHTRACSILKKAAEEGAPFDRSRDPREAAKLLTHQTEGLLAKTVAGLPRIIDDCARDRKAHTLASYAEGLASIFNAFYRDVPVLQGGELRQPRLMLVEASRVALANALDTLGIIAPEQM
jgi:arginyl-tRNA synthetase